jgi:hypothetical protein
MSLLEHDKIPAQKLLIDYFNSEISRFECILKDLKHKKNTDYNIANEVFLTLLKDVWN